MEFPLAVGLLSLILILGVWFPVVKGGPELPVQDMLVGLVIVGVPVVNLLRYERAPWGCLPLALSVVVWGGLFASDVDPLICAGVVVAPNALFLLGELVLGPPLRRARRTRLVAELDLGAPVEREVELLGDRDAEVHARAAAAVAARPWPEVASLLAPLLASVLPPRGLLGALRGAAGRNAAEVSPWVAEHLASATAELHQPLGELLGRHGASCPSQPDARVGHALGMLEHDPTAGAAALVTVLGDTTLTPAQRQVALEALERAPTAEVLALARAALDANTGTAELLWVFHDHGNAEDAPRVSAQLSANDYDVANASVDALAGVLARGELGEHGPATLAAVQQAHAQLRAEHPPGQNRLADGLAVALTELEADLSSPAPNP